MRLLYTALYMLWICLISFDGNHKYLCFASLCKSESWEAVNFYHFFKLLPKGSKLKIVVLWALQIASQKFIWKEKYFLCFHFMICSSRDVYLSLEYHNFCNLCFPWYGFTVLFILFYLPLPWTTMEPYNGLIMLLAIPI